MRTILIIIFAVLSMNVDARKETTMEQKKDNLETATLGGGCFWCTEAIYERLKGVHSAVSGYSGGTIPNPTYKEVTSGRTGHAEVIQIRFDPGLVSYRDILKVFFETHDPTTLNRQGADVGTQYRSIILFHGESQRQIAEETIGKLEEAQIWKNPIVTQVEAFESFYPAEDYHQEYYENNPNVGYCRVVIQPKVDKFEKAFREMLK
jgi:methionine-S-sulfoxide reductase